jgi:hypothetical protein
MADEDDKCVEDAFDALVSITEKSGNLRKGLKKDILENVSILRKVFSKMKTQIENKSGDNKKLIDEVMKVREEMAKM